MLKAKKIKQAVGCLMALTMVMTNSFFGIGIMGQKETVAHAETYYTTKFGNMKYKFKELDNNSIEITSCEGTDTDIVIPEEMYGNRVVSIGDYAFRDCNSVTSIKIPNSVTSIGFMAFYNCSSLISIDIPNSVTTIGERVFVGCENLISIEIPASVISMDGAFGGYNGLETIQVDQDNVQYKSTKDGVLYNKEMTKLLKYPGGKKDKEYIISDNVTSIGGDAFAYCSSLTSVEIPNSVTSIGVRAFSYCSSLTSVEIPNSVTSIGEYAFSGCVGLTEIEIPSSVTRIENGTFHECNGLTEVKISDSVDSIGDWTFKDCTNLNSIQMSSNVKYIGVRAFENCNKLTSIKLPNSLICIGQYAFLRCNNLLNIEIPNSVTNIGSYAFSDTAWYESQEDGIVYAGKVAYRYKGSIPSEIILQPDTVGIADCAFVNCKNLKKIEIPYGVTSINDEAFYGCSGLSSINIPASITDIGYEAFYECSGLTEVKIPSSVTSIDDEAFYGCINLKNIEVPDSVKYIGCLAFGNTAWYKNQEDGVIYIGKVANAYKGNSSEVTNINFKEDTVSISNCAFNYCDKLKNIEIPNSVTSIGKEAFAYCSSLSSVELPNSITSIEEMTFFKCINLNSIKIPSSVTSIGLSAFYGCSSLTSIEIPNSVTSIIKGAFSGCDKLTIYGKKGSYAEQYAKENNIPFALIMTNLIDTSTNIEVNFQENSISSDVFLQTKQLTSTDEEYKNIILTDKIVDSTVKPEDVKLSAYDISLVDEENTPVQPTGNVTVKIPCPANYNGEKCKVYRVSATGNFTDMNARYQNGYIVFETDHFSTYIITETELITQADVLLGDANGDGKTDLKDSAIIKRYLAGWDVEINMTAADMDKDGKVTIKDSALIKRQLAG